MTQAALAGAHIATVPFKVLQQMVHHPLTDKGIVQFKKDWEGARAASRREEHRQGLTARSGSASAGAGAPAAQLRRSRGTAAGTSAGSRDAATPGSRAGWSRASR